MLGYYVQRDLGIHLNQSLKVHILIQKSFKKANTAMAFIARGVDYKNKDVLQQLCTALIRPHLGHCVYF